MADWLSQLFDPDLASLSAAGVYALLFALVFIESGLLVGFMLPGDTVLFAAGLLAAREGSGLSLPVLAIGTTISAILGDAVGYWTGRRFGRPWVERRAGRAARHLPRRSTPPPCSPWPPCPASAAFSLGAGVCGWVALTIFSMKAPA